MTEYNVLYNHFLSSLVGFDHVWPKRTVCWFTWNVRTISGLYNELWLQSLSIWPYWNWVIQDFRAFVDGNFEWKFYTFIKRSMQLQKCNYRPSDRNDICGPAIPRLSTELPRDSCRALTTSWCINTKVMPMYGVWVRACLHGGRVTLAEGLP
jgi:hypothetical protein